MIEPAAALPVTLHRFRSSFFLEDIEDAADCRKRDIPLSLRR